MAFICAEKADAYLQNLVKQRLWYGIKSRDLDLYDFGFGCTSGQCNYALHATCRFKIIKRTGDRRVDKYYEDTSAEQFRLNFKPLIGLSVKRINLSEKNDLWFDFGDYWMVFATFENNEESWRILETNPPGSHLVVSNSWIEFLT